MSQQPPGYPQNPEQPMGNQPPQKQYGSYQDPYQQVPGHQYIGYAEGQSFQQSPQSFQQPPQKPKKSIWKRWWMICIYVLVGIMIISNLGGGESASQTDDAGHGSNSPSAASSAGAAAGSKGAVATFGGAFAYQDGLSVTVSAPKDYQPSEYSSDEGRFDTYVKFDVRVVNNTGKPWDPGMFNATVQSDNEEGEQIFDSEGGLDGAPSTKLLNGREVRFTVGYGVANPKDIVMEVNPDFVHTAVMFQS
ncbi:MAG: hypothetical protein SOH99_03070 [Acidipropionibacterium acidipropionici]|jgi:hypothetical protein|uniref:DUF4352 domain-containing protein n=1 Tax=Acidipropionibacterium acidipropionici (strain ATCC 4875 / DSM 20272 / JCM 6432 / NBRC 12425 / NCIMB 8070 / 4) TaxID=1171373 RepID=K7S1Y6_ACIA4|nr:hypothetical protein [Acidipropionibacterium acidipropionici]AFV88597.1 hypothetical protein PACID_07590 [Acidipropionibacterium acidipropionici ATCC 4875]ALN14070.1 hypothetical protein ASQ49_01020 [Acidipropionibacterium acidipropionici]APZ10168.1 hypothetical protein BWX38_13945 [Acidipropionibacterium acidipropionici]